MYSFSIRLLTEDPHQRLGAIGAHEVTRLFSCFLRAFWSFIDAYIIGANLLLRWSSICSLKILTGTRLPDKRYCIAKFKASQWCSFSRLFDSYSRNDILGCLNRLFFNFFVLSFAFLYFHSFLSLYLEHLILFINQWEETTSEVGCSFVLWIRKLIDRFSNFHRLHLFQHLKVLLILVTLQVATHGIIQMIMAIHPVNLRIQVMLIA